MAALLVFAFVVWTFVEVLRSPAPALKWAWAIFVLLGVGPLHLQLDHRRAQHLRRSACSWLGSVFSKPSAFDPLIVGGT